VSDIETRDDMSDEVRKGEAPGASGAAGRRRTSNLIGIVVVMAVLGVLGAAVWRSGGSLMTGETGDGGQLEAGVKPTATAVPVKLGFGVDGDELSGNVARIPTSEFSGEPILKIRKEGDPPLDPELVPVARGEPRLWILGLDETDFVADLGVVPADGPTTHAFIVQNLGRGPLEILETGGACGCTVGEIAETIIEPGGDTVLQISYDPRVSSEAGKDVTKQVYIASNDPLVPIAEFHFTASVEPLDE